VVTVVVAVKEAARSSIAAQAAPEVFGSY